MASSRRLHDKVAIITGASSGLGRAIALRYGLEGAKIVCADLTPTARSQEEAAITTHDLVIQNGGDAIFVVTDVGDAVQMENLVKAAVQTYERIDMYASIFGEAYRKRANLEQSSQQCWDQHRGTEPGRAASDRRGNVGHHDARQCQICLSWLQVRAHTNAVTRATFFR